MKIGKLLYMTRNFQQENGQPLQSMYLSCPTFLEKKKANK